jgi:hypothetical protein
MSPFSRLSAWICCRCDSRQVTNHLHSTWSHRRDRRRSPASMHTIWLKCPECSDLRRSVEVIKDSQAALKATLPIDSFLSPFRSPVPPRLRPHNRCASIRWLGSGPGKFSRPSPSRLARTQAEATFSSTCCHGRPPRRLTKPRSIRRRPAPKIRRADLASSFSTSSSRSAGTGRSV